MQSRQIVINDDETNAFLKRFEETCGIMGPIYRARSLGTSWETIYDPIIRMAYERFDTRDVATIRVRFYLALTEFNDKDK